MKAFFKVLVLGIAAFLMTTATPDTAKAAKCTEDNEHEGNQYAFVGTFCFKLDDWPDRWHWNVWHHGARSYQIVGFDEHFVPGSSMVGGGVIFDDHFYGTITHTHGDFRAVIRVDIDLETMSGTATYSWLDADHTVLSTFIDEPFSRVQCSGK